MASFDRIQPGQVLFTVTRQRAGNTTMTRQAVHSVVVVSVDKERRRCEACWNSNKPRTFFESSVKRWKVRDPRKSAPAAVKP
jgi:hypothetical protein